MSSSSITDPAVLSGAVERWSLPPGVVNPIKGIAFWTAIVLPFLYLPLLATGLQSRATILAFVLLVGLNVAALLVGHPYGSE